MTATRLMVIVFGIILIGGAITGIVATDLGYTVNDNTWAEPVADVVGGTIDIFNFLTTFLVGSVDSLLNIFNLGSGGTLQSDIYPNVIYINGSGTSGGDTVDGKYTYAGSGAGNKVYWDKVNTSIVDLREIQAEVDNNDNILNAQIRSEQFGFFSDWDIYNSTSVNNNEEFYQNWDLLRTNTSLNPTAEGKTPSLSSNTTKATATQQVSDFFQEAKNETKTSIRAVGVIPEAIGYPILIFFFIAIIIGIIKLLPTT